MEKSNPRSSAKSNSSDPKVKQDVTNKHLRLPRVKESVSPRPEARRKPQKNRELFDKRPRHKAEPVRERYRSEVATLDDHLDEFARQGSKKVNLNHLLNFTVTPLENTDHKTGTRRATFNRMKHPKYNKELFLQANCQFVARYNGNYSVHEKDPDILVEWPLIEEIRLPSHEVPLCPICLYSPIAAKITRCGHIYCWPCILHYLALTDKTWQKCPICFEAVHKNDLKSVSLRILKPFNVGDEITMYLMKREKGSLLTAPVTHQSPKQVCNVSSDDDVARFQKLLLANKKDINIIIDRERSELRKVYFKEMNTPEACFIESALKLLEEREINMHTELPLILFQNNTYQRQHLEAMGTNESHDENFAFDSADQNCNSPLSENISKNSSPISQDIPHDTETKRISHFNQDYVDQNYNSSLPENTSKNSSPIFQDIPHDTEKKGISYFYQAKDGQHIYMHNLNVRMLLKEFGSLESAPPVITARIVEIESVSMTEILRKRLRYLQHLPLTCEFQVVELNFSQHLMMTTLQQFEIEINKRKHLRSRKARDERRREKYIEQEENKKLGKFPKATYNLRSNDQFPSYHLSDFQALSPSKYASGAENNYVLEESSVHDEMNENYLSGSIGQSYARDTDAVPTTSFAQMLKDGPKTFNQVLKEKKKEMESPKKVSTTDSDNDNCYEISAPKYQQSLGDVIQAALESVNLQDCAGNAPKSGKKKKGKKQLLFTTSMCRSK